MVAAISNAFINDANRMDRAPARPRDACCWRNSNRGAMPVDERVDAGEYIDILREAVAARNGWKRILARCSPPSPARRRGLGAA